jgi:hypothetical protein
MDEMNVPTARIKRDHSYLATELGLDVGIELIVYQVTQADVGDAPVTLGHGLTSEWPHSGYKHRVISIAVNGHALEEASRADAPPPLQVWDGDRYGAWPEWRCDLWHEVCHQYQDERLKRWNKNDGNNGHRTGWREAVHAVADRVGCGRATFYELMRSPDVPPGA